ncbi:M50 family metallopeptidase [Streptomyces sp. ICBB 8177]|uniref:M50 family metallopeptidase n=1 Tax=Streptomyces sp. ICBB 8177 TaxID=563922 RepID=UPI000D67B0A0|nr:M50 family metallopeptidase [Streptomyces sp. ICBB 8177]PWI42183.1 hypothetical protein CK485_25850 [Streptomyces sp. ICBB 8177]
MNGSAPLGRVLGVPLRVHWSAPVLVLFLGVGLAGQTLPAWVPGRSRAVYDTAGLVGALLLTASLLLHETAHALTARRFGVRVDDITVWGLGGVTRMGRPSTPGGELMVALAGPLASLVTGGVAVALGFGVREALGWEVPAAVLVWTGWLNGLLAAFNLLPAAPLDGGRVLRAAVWWRGGDRERAEHVAGRAGQGAGLALAAAGFAMVVYGYDSGLWLALVGLFVWSAAIAEVRRAALVGALRGVRVGRLMSAAPDAVPEWLTVERFLAGTAGRGPRAVVPLVDFEGRPSGVVDGRRLALVPVGRRDEVRLRDAAVPLARCTVAAPDDELVEVLERAGATPPVLVVEDGRLVGVVTAETISRAALQRMPRRTHRTP